MTYVAGQKLKASQLGQASTCAEYNASADQTISTGTDTVAAYGTANTTSSLVTRNVSGVGHTFTLNRAGIWMITAVERYAAGAAGERYAALQVLTLTLNACGGEAGSKAHTMPLALCRAFSSGDIVRVIVYQDTGGNATRVGNNLAGWGRINLNWLGG